jgi:hypothetical protein
VIELLLNAESLLALGLLDEAERTYRSVLEADPRNGIAAVGLSRVALERGDEADALALARAALDIDPDNATARRMVDRLEEVARFRSASSATAAAPAAPAVPSAVPSAVLSAVLSAAPATPAPPAAIDSAAMIRASAVADVAPGDSFATRAAVAEGGADSLEHARGGSGSETGAGSAVPGPGHAVSAIQAAATHGSLTDSQEPGPTATPPAAAATPPAGAVASAGPTATPPGAAPPITASPARPGLLRRILRRS